MLRRLYYLREEKGMSLKALENKSGVSKSKLHRIENNNAIPKINEICKIAKALKVTPEQLFCDLIRDEVFYN